MLALFSLALAAPACGVDRDSYIHENQKILASLPVFPSARPVRVEHSPYSEGDSVFSPVVGYTTRAVYRVQEGTRASEVIGFYKQRLRSRWFVHEELSGPVVNFRRGRASLSLNLENIAHQEFEIAIDHESFGKLGRGAYAARRSNSERSPPRALRSESALTVRRE